MSGLTNKYIEDLTSMFVNKNFLGVYPSDVKPDYKNKKEFVVIFNLSKHNEPGSHFVVVIKRINCLIYFDSFGVKCSVLSIKKFLESFKLPIINNMNQIQHYSSNFCGYYCFYFTYYCFKLNKTLYEFIKRFDPITIKQNDSLLLLYILQVINKK